MNVRDQILESYNNAMRASKSSDAEVVFPKMDRLPYVDQGMELARLMKSEGHTTTEIWEVLEVAATAYMSHSLIRITTKEDK